MAINFRNICLDIPFWRMFIGIYFCGRRVNYVHKLHVKTTVFCVILSIMLWNACKQRSEFTRKSSLVRRSQFEIISMPATRIIEFSKLPNFFYTLIRIRLKQKLSRNCTLILILFVLLCTDVIDMGIFIKKVCKKGQSCNTFHISVQSHADLDL